MDQNKCPYCGVLIPTNSLTCPKCFKNIPREDTSKKEEYIIHDEPKSSQTKSKKNDFTLFLAIIPAFVGILGLNQIIHDPKDSKGYMYLIIGLILFITSVVLFVNIWHNGIWSAFFMTIAWIMISFIYIIAAIGVLIDAIMGSVLRIF